MEDRFALLIDADNVSAKYIKPILDELSKYGNVTYKRIYGDWTKTNNASWKEELLQNSITPIQQFSYTTGKNATDSAMIIDAMDMLYTSELEGFCLVSSDSDFTKLASRLRESGKTVIGMGEDKTPSPFRKACDIFTVLELLLEDNTDQDEKEEKGTPHQHHGKERRKDTAASKEQIEEAVVKIITENQNDDRETGLGEVGSRLVKLYPDFDVRRYGYSLLSKFLETLPRLKLIQEGTKVSVTLYEDKSRQEMVEEYILRQIQANGRYGISLGSLGNRIRARFGNFKVRDYGFSQFKQYIQSFPNVQIVEDMEQLARSLQKQGIAVYAAALHREAVALQSAGLSKGGCAVAVGNEGNGLPAAFIEACNGCIQIPMQEGSESLNAAMAAGIILWEMARQDRP